MLVDFRSTTAWSKRDNSWPIKKMMYETTDLQHLKLKKRKIRKCVIAIITQ